jgi:hypothetical protein
MYYRKEKNRRNIIMDKREFINSVKDGALKGYSEFGILPSLTIAQAILESSWGQSNLSEKANNLFGVKSSSNWTGEKITMETTEWYGDKKLIVKAEFRAYDSFNHSIEDHNKLLSYSRYKPVRECKDYKEACQKVYECGYATDPKYAEKLINIIEDNRLYEFDGGEVKEVGDTIRSFQKLCNELQIRDYEGKALVEDNHLGQRTRSCIAKMPVLRQGSRGQAVEFIQQVVKAEPVDGKFGPATKQCVMDFQKEKNIKVDGIVGPQTWTAILTA